MKLDHDILLESFGDDEPSGPNLEYDPDFAELTIAAQSKGEQQVGDQVKEAEEADYTEVIRIGLGLLSKSKDLRIALYLAEAGLNREGFPAFGQILEYIHRALAEHWDTVHPQLDEDDDDDPTERINALVGLVDEQGVLRQLRRAPLTDGKVMGQYSLRHLAVVKGEMAAPADMEDVPNEATINAAFQDTPEEKMSAIVDGISASVEHLAAIESLMDQKLPGQSPDFSNLTKMLRSAQSAVQAGTGGALSVDIASGDDVTGGAIASTGGGSVATGGGVGGISSSSDVTKAIDLILEYYQRSEPSSPVPIILTRAKRLVAADFMTIIQDLASSGEDEVRQIGGNPREDEY